ncbi:hypothetical protein Mro03_51540 [Microbispora rosea subsp. rosea]|nr:hypothetical protein Mro03_51540 [Microbispora rosea subsp. rosea]
MFVGFHFVDPSDKSAMLVGRRPSLPFEWTHRICPAGLTMTLRQPSMLAVMSVPPTTNQAQGADRCPDQRSTTVRLATVFG